MPTVEHDMANGAWFAGSADEMVERPKGLEARYPGLETVNLSCSMGTPKEIMIEQYHRIAEEIMPHFGK